MSDLLNDAAQLLQVVELTDVVVYETAGRRLPETRDEAVEQTVNVAANGGPDWFETRCRIFVQTPEADLLADVGARYTAAEPFDATTEALQDFTQRVGVMTVFPYLRENIQTTASRLGVPAPVIGLLRQGSFRVDPPAEASAVETGSDIS